MPEVLGVSNDVLVGGCPGVLGVNSAGVLGASGGLADVRLIEVVALPGVIGQESKTKY